MVVVVVGVILWGGEPHIFEYLKIFLATHLSSHLSISFFFHCRQVNEGGAGDLCRIYDQPAERTCEVSVQA